jgi:hypothetical protein
MSPDSIISSFFWIPIYLTALKSQTARTLLLGDILFDGKIPKCPEFLSVLEGSRLGLGKIRGIRGQNRPEKPYPPGVSGEVVYNGVLFKKVFRRKMPASRSGFITLK